MFSNSGCASMGYDLPAGLGAALAAKDYEEGGSTIVLAGMVTDDEPSGAQSHRLNLTLFSLY